MKSANCISATGRMPIIAAPVQAPTMAVSASGASSTRHSPNSAWKPWVTLKAPPYTPTSSPMTKTRSSRRISSRRPSEMACRYVFTATPLQSSASVACRVSLQPSDARALLVVRGVELLGLGPDAVGDRLGVRQRARLGPLDRVVELPLDLDLDLLVTLGGELVV